MASRVNAGIVHDMSQADNQVLSSEAHFSPSHMNGKECPMSISEKQEKGVALVVKKVAGGKRHTLYVGLPDENTMRGTQSRTSRPRNSKVPCTPHRLFSQCPAKPSSTKGTSRNGT